MNAINAYNKLNANVAGLKKASEKLSSGYRINRAGDDAAGLAISEKMRSQIRGLNQAIRNSQDGINMIQTFEGAAQETHTILQRMKELATESANGTYDNATDRAAIQLEFEQLNDELNQIADTDFNGTIVLNGGQMADGVTATIGDNGLGEFDYAKYYADQKAAAEEAAANAPVDISGELEPDQMLDNHAYNQAIAKKIWDAVGLDASEYDKINITFTYDGSEWKATAVTDASEGADNALIEKAQKALDTLNVTATGASGKGGFDIKLDDDDTLHVVFDGMDVNGREIAQGDTVTLYFENTAEKTYAPTHAAVFEDTLTPGTINWKKGDLKISVELNADYVTDANMEKDDVLNNALEALAAAEFSLVYDANGNATLTSNDLTGWTIAEETAGSGVWTITDDQGNDIATITITNDGGEDTPAVTDATIANGETAADLTITNVPDGSYTYVDNIGWIDDSKVSDATVENGDISVTLNSNDLVAGAGDGDYIIVKDGGITAGSVQGTGAAQMSTTLADGIYYKDATGWHVVDESAVVDATNVVGGTYATGDTITVETSKVPTGDVTFQLDIAAFNKASADDLQAHAVATPDTAKGADLSDDSNGPTKADAFENSTARLTYANHIILQTGSRSKDAVDFTFSYNTDGTADMGDLEANLNISARNGGLNTESLSLATQDEANYAIDQIDKAINKVSMVRATFGAIQNRLEHKITNLTTTSENLTEAESSIRDTDMAQEMMNYTKYNILQQAAQSMLAQANQQPQSILQLLG